MSFHNVHHDVHVLLNMSARKCISLRRYPYTDFADILDIVEANTVPVEELRITECSWRFTNRGLWSKCLRKIPGKDKECPYGCPVPAPPSSLQSVDIIGLPEGTDPMPLALWLIHSRNPSLQIKWSFQFSLFDETCQKTSHVLAALGSRLTTVSLNIDVRGSWNESAFSQYYSTHSWVLTRVQIDFHKQNFPKLSNNTGLKSFTLIDVVPDVCPPNYLEMVIGDIASSELETLTIRFYVFTKEEASLDYFDFEGLGRVLCPAGFQKFPQLKTLTFCLSANKRNASKFALDAASLKHKMLKEMSFLKAWQNAYGLQVNTLTTYIIE